MDLVVTSLLDTVSKRVRSRRERRDGGLATDDIGKSTVSRAGVDDGNDISFGDVVLMRHVEGAIGKRGDIDIIHGIVRSQGTGYRPLISQFVCVVIVVVDIQLDTVSQILLGDGDIFLAIAMLRHRDVGVFIDPCDIGLASGRDGAVAGIAAAHIKRARDDLTLQESAVRCPLGSKSRYGETVAVDRDDLGVRVGGISVGARYGADTELDRSLQLSPEAYMPRDPDALAPVRLPPALLNVRFRLRRQVRIQQRLKNSSLVQSMSVDPQ